MADVTIAWTRSCRISLGGRAWGYAAAARPAIAADWRRISGENPHFFNGVVHLLDAGYRLDRERLAGEAIATDFASFHHWRRLSGAGDQSVRGIGAAVVLRSREGHVLLGEASSRVSLPGRIYVFAGVVDERDVGAEGTIEIERAALRELTEETGLAVAELEREPGLWVVDDGVIVNIVLELRSAEPAERLRDLILARVARQDEPEIADVHVLRSPADISPERTLAHSARLAERLLGS